MEICVDSFQSAINAECGGASRLELCSCLDVGGVTPSLGLFQLIKEHVKIPIFVLIRPRPADFLYNEDEIKVMIKDINAFKASDANGFVIGVLKEDATVDEEKMNRLMDACRPLPVTFHRAIDMCADPLAEIDLIISLGIQRILTSGKEHSASLGIEMIHKMNEKAQNRIIIMPGSGITDKSLPNIIEKTNCKEYHASAKKEVESQMKNKNICIHMGKLDTNTNEFTMHICDDKMVKRMVDILKPYLEARD